MAEPSYSWGVVRLVQPQDELEFFRGCFYRFLFGAVIEIFPGADGHDFTGFQSAQAEPALLVTAGQVSGCLNAYGGSFNRPVILIHNQTRDGINSLTGREGGCAGWRHGGFMLLKIRIANCRKLPLDTVFHQ